MTFGYRLVVLCAAPAFIFVLADGADAGNRKAFKSLTAKAEAYCTEIKEREVYECSVEKCPCADGLREVKRFDKIRTRAACVCTPDTGRERMNEANATDFCVDWNNQNAKEGDSCFVVEGQNCPAGTSPMKTFSLLRGRGPAQTACRGEPPKEEEEEEEDTKNSGAK